MALCLVVVTGCGRRDVEGVYRDVSDPSIRYELRDDGSWSAELIVEIPAGVFAHGASRRLDGTYNRSGSLLELVCLNASRQDPISGEYRPEGAAALYNHLLSAEEDSLVPVGPKGEKDAVFAADLNPLGARQLVREEESQ